MNKVILILLVIAIASLNTNSYGDDNLKQRKNGPYQHIDVYFLPGTLELIIHDLDGLIRNLNRTSSYQIQGYACNDDKGSEEELLSVAARRADTVRKILVQKGFPSSKLTATAYDKDNDCKAVIIETGE